MTDLKTPPKSSNQHKALISVKCLSTISFVVGFGNLGLKGLAGTCGAGLAGLREIDECLGCRGALRGRYIRAQGDGL